MTGPKGCLLVIKIPGTCPGSHVWCIQLRVVAISNLQYIYILLMCVYNIQTMILRNWLLKNRQKVSGEDFPEKNGYRTDVSCPELRFGDGCEELHW